MATYTVQKGDTLSGIAKKLGLPSYNALTGYRSGNPNLIYSGEVLNYGSPNPAPAAAPAAPASNPLVDYAKQQAQQQQALLDRQKAEQQGFFNQYTQKLEGQEQLPGMYQRLQQEQGIPELQNQLGAYKDEIYKVKGLLDRLGEDVTARTQGTYTTEAMRRRIEASEAEDMQTTLGRLGTGMQPIAEMLTGAQSQLSTLLPLSIQQQQKELQPLEMQINALGDRFAREITGFNSNKETTLTALLDKLERDRFLADRDWELAQQLAAEEREFSRQKSLAKMSASQYLSPSGGGSTAPQAARALPKAQPVQPNQINITGGGNLAQLLNSGGLSSGLQGSGGLTWLR